MQRSGDHGPRRIGKRTNRRTRAWILALAVGMGILLILGGGVVALVWSGILHTKGKRAAREWHEYSNKEIGFSVSMPGTPNESVDGQTTWVTLRTGSGDFIAVYGRISPAPGTDSKTVLEAFKQSLEKRTQTASGASKLITLQGYPGIEFSVSAQGSTASCRAYYLDHAIVSLMVGPTEKANGEDIQRFLDSLRFSK